ncbi:MAG: DNA repair protein RecN [Rhodospirillales bacterium]|nr:DNA repair protein RecN [Rhodospirillales bacterium]
MLSRLSIRELVLIERLDLDFGPGLTVLTGETGAGKSILLDALGLALGARAEGRLVRGGARQAQVVAAFDLEAGHPALNLAASQDLVEPGELLLLKRWVTAEGRSRASVNDRPVSAGLLRSLGDFLVEIQGQFDQRGLLDWRNHSGFLDAFGRAGPQVTAVRGAYREWRAARDSVSAAADRLARAREQEENLRHALEELTALDPQTEEVARLAEERQLLMHRSAILNALGEVEQGLFGSGRAENLTVRSLRALERVAEKAGERLDPLLQTLERALGELEEAGRLLAGLTADSDLEPDRLAEVEDRFFALKDLARKHGVEPDNLPALMRDLARRLEVLENGTAKLSALEETAEAAEAAFRETCRTLSVRRQAAAAEFDAAVAVELAPLRLEHARFVTDLAGLPPEDWGAGGAERVQFLIAANPGAEPGPLAKIASGGELARLLLALGVVLSRQSAARTLVFDEVDAGIGGATAAAVGERLERLAGDSQVLVVTHSPQVAARGRQHLQVSKSGCNRVVRTAVASLETKAREEEIARMLAGTEVTPEARRAAAKLLESQA